MPLLPTLLRLLLVAALAVNGWVLPAHAMADGAPAATAAAAGGCHEAPVAAATAGDAVTPGVAPADGPFAADADGGCCESDSCSDCRCAMAGSIAPPPASRIAPVLAAATPSTAAAPSPRTRRPGHPLRPPIA